jgi:hypothetical protein
VRHLGYHENITNQEDSMLQQLNAIQATVNPGQVSQQLDDKQKLEMLQSAINGSDLVQGSGTNAYYLRTSIQKSSGSGQEHVRVDRELAEEIIKALDSGGRISTAEVMNNIMPKLTDGNHYGDGEAILARMLLAACDDRKVVKLCGKRIHITEKAEETLKHELFSFWGEMGAKARWADDPVGE